MLLATKKKKNVVDLQTHHSLYLILCFFLQSLNESSLNHSRLSFHYALISNSIRLLFFQFFYFVCYKPCCFFQKRIELWDQWILYFFFIRKKVYISSCLKTLLLLLIFNINNNIIPPRLQTFFSLLITLYIFLIRK